MLNEHPELQSYAPEEKHYIPNYIYSEVDLKKYALSIIFHVKSFEEFAVAMMDYAGRSVYPQIADLYNGMNHVAFEKGLYLEDEKLVKQCTERVYADWFQEFLSRDIGYQYDYFEEEYNFIKQTRPFLQYFPLFLRQMALNPHLSIFNLVLVFLQNPYATVVHPAHEWQEMGYDRINYLKPLITLLPYGPIQLMYDLKDIYGAAGSPEYIAREQLGKRGQRKYMEPADLEKTYDQLIRNMAKYGIGLEISFLATMPLGGFIIPDKPKLSIAVDKRHIIDATGEYAIYISSQTKEAERLYELCLQLGHYFCRHLDNSSSIISQMSVREKEFEAESVAWIVCKRLGMEGLSEDYIHRYMSNGELPFFRIFQIAKAADAIEKLLFKRVSLQDTPWGKKNNEIQIALKKINKGKKSTKTERK